MTPSRPSEPLMHLEKTHPSTTAKNTGKRVLLICPPFHYPKLSSLCIAQLATYLRENGVHCREAYLHLEFLRLLGEDRYDIINSVQDGRTDGQTAELFFSEGLHGEIVDAKWKKALDALVGPFKERSAMRDRFERRTLARIEYERPDIVGITTSYNQLLAALWIARAIKQAFPEMKTVLGGTACLLPMGRRIQESYPQVDFVVSGFGEQPLLNLGRGITPTNPFIECPEPVALEEIPLPDYRPFLREVKEMNPNLSISLLFQSSRGCWWGEKKHCTFCGLNGGQMTYTAKSSAHVVNDIRTLWERYGCNLIATDSIMARDHLKNALPDLARFQARPTVFYEMKANVTEADVIAMAHADVVGQIGIESLSTRLLKILNKGVTCIRVLALLKWCREQHVDIAWNQLCGIPGETAEDYDEQISLIESIPHFHPPFRVNPIVIDRFSPYFESFQQFGWRSIEPFPQYRQAHPHLNEEALTDIAYHFEGRGGVSTDAYIERFEAAVKQWKERHEQGDGLYWNSYDGFMTKVEDSEAQNILVNETVRRIIDCTHTIAPVSRVIEQTQCEPSLLDEMVQNGFLYMENKNLINLTVRTPSPK